MGRKTTQFLRGFYGAGFYVAGFYGAGFESRTCILNHKGWKTIMLTKKMHNKKRITITNFTHRGWVGTIPPAEFLHTGCKYVK